MLVVGLFPPYTLIATPVFNGEIKAPKPDDYEVEADKPPGDSKDTLVQNSANKNAIQEFLNNTVIKYGLDENFIKVAYCESGFNPNAVGDKGSSLGLWQIHLPAHPTVTPEQAFDPYWSTEWAVRKYQENPYIWTCYRLI